MLRSKLLLPFCSAVLSVSEKCQFTCNALSQLEALRDPETPCEPLSHGFEAVTKFPKGGRATHKESQAVARIKPFRILALWHCDPTSLPFSPPPSPPLNHNPSPTPAIPLQRRLFLESQNLNGRLYPVFRSGIHSMAFSITILNYHCKLSKDTYVVVGHGLWSLVEPWVTLRRRLSPRRLRRVWEPPCALAAGVYGVLIYQEMGKVPSALIHRSGQLPKCRRYINHRLAPFRKPPRACAPPRVAQSPARCGPCTKALDVASRIA
ncbi:hypothetical protein C8R43DRAFT_948400 [Mycena crocata]|nr:hypothetical protein C8R43DRAFT_948400 [Mycena crocata]